MLMVALGMKGMVIASVTGRGRETGVRMSFHIGLNDGEDFLRGIPGFQIVPDADGKL